MTKEEWGKYYNLIIYKYKSTIQFTFTIYMVPGETWNRSYPLWYFTTSLSEGVIVSPDKEVEYKWVLKINPMEIALEFRYACL